MEQNLPPNWQLIKLPDIAYFQEGPGLRKFQYTDKGIPFLNIRTINNETIDKELCGFLSVDEVNRKYKHFLLDAGDIVCSTSGTIGKTALIQKDDLPLMLNTSIVRFRSLDEKKLNKYFLYFYLRSNWFMEQANTASTGTTQKNIGPSHLQNFLVPLPPIDKQVKISSKLNDIFERLNTIKLRLENLVGLSLKTVDLFLRNPESSKYYPSEKLDKYLIENSKRIGKNWEGLNKVGVSAKKGIIDLDVGMKSSFENYKVVNPGDFIYNTMRVNIGSIAQYKGEKPAITSPDYVVFKIQGRLSPHLLLGFLKSAPGLMEINNHTKGSVRSRLYFRSLANINYPIAPDDLQEQAETILRWFSVSIETFQERFTKNMTSLSTSILEMVFSGKPFTE
jgi:type I restriction enzyme, S subunit